MSTVIRIEEVSKKYRLGEINRRMLYQELQSRWARFRGKEDPNSPLIGKKQSAIQEEDNDLWALRNISFDIKDGEVVGIIGRNGAGKSTLLKILSEITSPSEGRVLMKGKVASLLEVGTGFHQELTGRENVYLNGAILGMTKNDVASKFDAIAAFSGVEDFLETPVKRYSSGMRVRLAFAVAAHLDPEILIIDEVLAVGDASFQQKCLGKLGDVAREGRTVLFVSHNMPAVENLCQRGVVLDKGRVQFAGTQTEAISYYLDSVTVHQGSLRDRMDRNGTGDIRVTSMEVRDCDGKVLNAASSGQDVDIYFHFEKRSVKSYPNLNIALEVINQYEVPIFFQFNHLTSDVFGNLPSKGAFVCRIRRLPLPQAIYKLSFKIQSDYPSGHSLDSIRDAVELRVERGDFYGSGQFPGGRKGLCLVDARWRLEDSAS